MKRFVLGGMFLAAAAFAVGCKSSDGGPDAGGPQAPAPIFHSVSREVMGPGARAFSQAASALVGAAEVYRGAPGDDELAALRAAWREATGRWQYLEALQIGPAAPLTQKGGEGLRDEIYSWPTSNPCRVDQALMDERYAQASFPAGQLVFVYGLDAMEYLLFSDPDVQSCGAEHAIAAPFAALLPEQRRARRARYAAALAAHVAGLASRIEAAWDPANTAGFAHGFERAGADGSPFRSKQEAMSALFFAMFYLDLKVKDLKLARPAALTPGCAQASCPELLESPRAEHAASSLAVNLEAFEDLFRGGKSAEAVGVDDELLAAGAGDLATDLLAKLGTARQTLAAFDRPLHVMLTEERSSVVTLHAQVKQVTDLLKGPLALALMLSVPEEGAADND